MSEEKLNNQSIEFKFDMTVDFDGLRENLICSLERLTKLVKDSRTTNQENKVIDGYSLEKRLADLRNDVVMIAAIINPNTDKHLLTNEREIDYFDFDEELDGTYGYEE